MHNGLMGKGVVKMIPKITSYSFRNNNYIVNGKSPSFRGDEEDFLVDDDDFIHQPDRVSESAEECTGNPRKVVRGFAQPDGVEETAKSSNRGIFEWLFGSRESNNIKDSIGEVSHRVKK